MKEYSNTISTKLDKFSYIDEQIKIENKYKELLIVLIYVLLGRLEDSPTTDLLLIMHTWKSMYANRIKNINQEISKDIITLVQRDIIKPNSYSLLEGVILSKNLNYVTDNLLYKIVGMVGQYIPVLATIVPNTKVTIPMGEISGKVELAISRLCQNSVSEAVSNLVAYYAQKNGYSEYLADNMHDNNVRPTHKHDNNGETWHKFGSPPESNLPGIQFGCRCFYISFR